jgi:hypothetical protein
VGYRLLPLRMRGEYPPPLSYPPVSRFLLSYEELPGDQDLTVSGIASVEALGTPSFGLEVTPTGVAGAEALGTPAFILEISPAGVSSDEALGTPALVADQSLAVTGTASSETLGTPAFGLELVVEGVASDESLGAPAFDLELSPAGIASGEALGAPALTLTAAPTVVGVGTVASAAGTAVTPGLPTGWAADDIHVLLVETASTEGVSMTDWNLFLGLPLDAPTGEIAITGTRLTAFWRRAQSGDTAPTVPNTGTVPANHVIARIIGVRGCPTTGDPFDVTAAANDDASSTSVSFPAVTTTVADCLILNACTTRTDVASTAHISGFANGALNGITEQVDNWTGSGNGGGIGACTGVKATAGAVGNTTATLVTANPKAALTVAFKPSSADQNLTVVGIASGEALGAPAFGLEISPAGIASGEALGTPSFGLMASLAGIASGEALGTPGFAPELAVSGIASVEVLGMPAFATDLTVDPAGIPSSEALGLPILAVVEPPLPAGIDSRRYGYVLSGGI